LKGKQKERVEQFGEQAILSKKLATIIIDVPVEWNEQDLAYSGPDVEKLKPILEELEFKTMMPRIFGLQSGETTSNTITASPKAAQLSMFGLETTTDESVSVEKVAFNPENVSYKTLQTPEDRASLIEKT
jgi:DNA polymerase-1